MHGSAATEMDLEVEMELVYEWTADAHDDFLAETLEDSWFDRTEAELAELADSPIGDAFN